MMFLVFALQILSYVVIADAVLSFLVPSRDQFPRNITSKITEPLYRPIRRVLDPRKTGNFDLSPMVVIVAIQVIRSLIVR